MYVIVDHDNKVIALRESADLLDGDLVTEVEAFGKHLKFQALALGEHEPPDLGTGIWLFYESGFRPFNVPEPEPEPEPEKTPEEIRIEQLEADNQSLLIAVAELYEIVTGGGGA